ncbi:MAG: hypothetical protein Q8R66_06710 [Methanobacteriaceae archaeon]|nr:hypothetical protein [Methanobacteriaceae archaeon]
MKNQAMLLRALLLIRALLISPISAANQIDKGGTPYTVRNLAWIF